MRIWHANIPSHEKIPTPKIKNLRDVPKIKNFDKNPESWGLRSRDPKIPRPKKSRDLKNPETYKNPETQKSPETQKKSRDPKIPNSRDKNPATQKNPWNFQKVSKKSFWPEKRKNPKKNFL